MTDAGAVELSGIEVTWPGPGGGRTAVAGLDLRVEPGSFLAIVGPSGCGKSTVLRILAGLLAPSAGTATIDGADVVGVGGRCAWMPQHDALLPWRTVAGNAVLGAEVAGLDRREATARARALLGRFGLGDVADAWPGELSGGMRQRVAVLRAFLTPAPVLALDEPFGALDALTRRDMQAWLQEVWLAEHRRTVVMVTHDTEEALLLADRVVVMAADPGRIVHAEAVLFDRPRPPDLVSDPEFVARRAGLLAALGL